MLLLVDVSSTQPSRVDGDEARVARGQGWDHETGAGSVDWFLLPDIHNIVGLRVQARHLLVVETVGWFELY